MVAVYHVACLAPKWFTPPLALLVPPSPPPSLIHLYVDIELTDRHNTFYEKFTVRYQIGEIMAYLWQLPQVRGLGMERV